MKFAYVYEQIIGCAIKVSNTLGAVFLEKVYENALAHELRKVGLLPNFGNPRLEVKRLVI